MMAQTKNCCPVCGREISPHQKYCCEEHKKVFEFSWELAFLDNAFCEQMETLITEEKKSKCF